MLIDAALQADTLAPLTSEFSIDPIEVRPDPREILLRAGQPFAQGVDTTSGIDLGQFVAAPGALGLSGIDQCLELRLPTGRPAQEEIAHRIVLAERNFDPDPELLVMGEDLSNRVDRAFRQTSPEPEQRDQPGGRRRWVVLVFSPRHSQCQLDEGREESMGGVDGSALGALEGSSRVVVADLHHGVADATPVADDGLDPLIEHLDFLHLEIPAHGVVVEGAGPPEGGHVEAGEVATRRTSVADGGRLRYRIGHQRSVTPRPDRSGGMLDDEHLFDSNGTVTRPSTRPDNMPGEGRQWSLDDLGDPLIDTVFVVIDVETTGGSPGSDVLTEVGAVRLRGGAFDGTFSTLINPGRAIPPSITVLTGITASMVLRAPRIESVLPSLLEFIGDAVVVGHNVRFDLGFLEAALERSGRPPLQPRSVCTLALARRLLRDEVPNCRLGTLAERLRLPHQPSHRALEDALATADLLHVLLDRAGRLGVCGLDDLLSLPGMAGHPQARKLRLTDRLPRSPGVYLFRDTVGRVLYVGKATNLRARVRSYFSTDDRRKVGPLLRETERIDHKSCPSTLEAEVLEARLIRDLLPRYNRHGTNAKRSPYVKLTLGEPFPRLSVVRQVRSDGAHYLGPLGSAAQARSVVEAIESVVPLRRCRQPVSPGAVRSAPCTAAQLGVATCPCAGGVDSTEYAAHVQRVLVGLTSDPATLLGPLRERMNEHAAAQRFEEAALVRERLTHLSRALQRDRAFRSLADCVRLVIGLPDGGSAELRHGVLWRMWPAEPTPLWGERADASARDVEVRPDHLPETGAPLPADLAVELVVVDGWLRRHASDLRVEEVDGVLASSWPRVEVIRQTQPSGTARRR